MIKKFIREAYRVLKPGGGTLLINTISPEQCKTPWYFSLLPQGQAQISSKYDRMNIVDNKYCLYMI
jgi:ubiquinone/menaquinone biosynthesis C-methylase UbiE